MVAPRPLAKHTTKRCGYPWNAGKHLSPSASTGYDIEAVRRRYFANTSGITWPPEVRDYNKNFTKTLEMIKKRHDPTVTTVAQGVLEWKRSCNAKNINLDVQSWLDRFYLSRIGIRFLIGQRTQLVPISFTPH